ncbi:hypothetical protein [Actinotalea sp. K2]|uniref:hypothetical protein n=1 Tax=Actinotalea sp. K2 TaxID=2939438 RepID=UPI0020176E21|nr:hypothetical protein [Actinotalea sp. K2]MCL3860780.1 hypothetical protein [Actinotalea sp. K2]
MMYAAIWRLLPGPVWLRVILALALVVGVVAVCFQWVFPAIAPFMPFNEITVDE